MIQIVCDGKTYNVKEGTTVLEFQKMFVSDNNNVVGALVNNVYSGLDTTLYQNRHVSFLTLSDHGGQRIYLSSLTMLLEKAIHDILTEGSFIVEHSISDGYFIRILSSGQAIDNDTIQAIKARMVELVKADIPIKRITKPTPEVVDVMTRVGNTTAANILKYSKSFYTHYYDLDGTIDYMNTGVVPSTSYLKSFDLSPYYDGVLLRFPKTAGSTECLPLVLMPKLYETYKSNWSPEHKASITGIADVNNVSKDDLPSLIRVLEAVHEKRIVHIADQITSNPAIKVVLIAGPSSSGKTTFAKRLSVQLAASGVIPKSLSLDNFFVNRDMNPRDKNGELDFESLYSLDLDRFYNDLAKIIAGEIVETPIYDFETGQRSQHTITIQLHKSEVLIIEGTHALNPELTKTLPKEALFKVFVSALNTTSFNDHICIPADDTRLLRRIIRDYKYRAYSAEDTILRWPSVRRGELKWIEPFQENANVMFNSTLMFEMSATSKQALPLLLDVPHYSNAYPVAFRLINILRFIKQINFNDIPTTSLLREFLGGSGFRY